MSNQEVCKKSTSKNGEWGIAMHRYQLTRDVIMNEYSSAIVRSLITHRLRHRMRIDLWHVEIFTGGWVI